MIKFYACEEEGFVERQQWQPHYWIDVGCPGDRDCEFLRSQLGLPDSFLESIADIDERPRFDREDGWIMTILRIPHRDDSDPLVYSTVPLGVMTKDDFIVTVCHKFTDVIPDFISLSNRRHISVDNLPDFILHLIYTGTSWFLRYLQDINRIVTKSTEQLERSVRNRDLLNLMKLQKALVYFNTSLQGNSMLTERLNKVFVDDCDPDLLEDTDIEISQATNTVDVYMEILSNCLDTFANVISNNVNDIMKTMTSVSIVLMIPTLIASFYGMNVSVWGGSARYAFLAIILVSFGLSAIVYAWLRKVRWL